MASPECSQEPPVSDGERSADIRFRSPAHWQAAVDHVPSLIAYIDSDQRYQFANEAFRTWFGIDPGMMIGRTVGEVFGPDTSDRSQARFARVMSGETVHFQTELFVGKRKRLLDATYAPDRDEQGIVRGFYLTASDATGWEKSEEALRELSALQVAILDSVNLAIMTEDLRAILWTFNTTAEEWLGCRGVEVIGHSSLERFLEPTEWETRRSQVENQTGRPVRTIFDWVMAVSGGAVRAHDEREWTLVRKDGTRFPVALALTALRDAAGEPTGLLAVARDIAVEKQAALSQRRAREAAERASNAKSQFLAHMSHEVRTPLHGIIGVTGMLLDTLLDEKQRPLAETVHASAEALLAVVGRVLDFSKIEAGKLALDVVDFSPAAVVGEVVRLHSVRAEMKGVVTRWRVAPDVPRVVSGDSDRLRQIVHNLVGNAVKFSSGGTVSIDVECVPEVARLAPGLADPVVLKIQVRDEGIGIPEDVQSRIFEPFTQADESTSRRFGGTGLGLAIARQLVELMGGDIGVESEPGQGATFWFTAPFGATGKQVSDVWAHPVSSAQSSSSERQLHVLLVEDSETNRMVARHQLDRLGCVLTVVDDGAAAIEAAAAKAFDLILMDCQMSGIDGYAATSEIRRQEEGRWGSRSFILALTALAGEGERERCLAAGMDEYLAKPFQPLQLALVARVASARLPPAGNVALIDRNALESLRSSPSSDGGPLLDRLVEIFRQEGPSTLQAIRDAVRAEDSAALELTSHKLRGASRNFGAARLQWFCQLIEDLSHAGLVRFVPILLPGMEVELRETLAALDAELQPSDAT